MSWPVVRLADVASIERQGIGPEEISPGSLYVGLENLTSEGAFLGVRGVTSGELASSKFTFTGEHLLYGKLRPYLSKIARPTFSGVCSTDILPILPGPKLDRNYLHHFLRQPQLIDFAASRAVGINLPRLSPSLLATFEIPLPPLAEQKRIAAILDAADALRAKRRATLAKLDQLAQSIFIEMFGDPASNPKGWPKLMLADVVRDGDRINYGVVQPGDDVEDGIPMIRVADVVGEEIHVNRLKCISKEVESNYQRSRLEGDEILVACVGSVGAVALAHESLKGANIARAVSRIRVNESKVYRRFVSEQLRTAAIQNYFKAEIRVVAQPTLNIKQLCETNIIVPAIEAQQRYVQRLSVLDCSKRFSIQQTLKFDQVFHALQHRAFKGEL